MNIHELDEKLQDFNRIYWKKIGISKDILTKIWI